MLPKIAAPIHIQLAASVLLFAGCVVVSSPETVSPHRRTSQEIRNMRPADL